MKAVSNLLEKIKSENIKFINFRFTDMNGKWHQLTLAARNIDSETFSEGVPFDASSVIGWKSIDDSDMLLMPDVSSAVLDPFAALKTMIISCDVVSPDTKEPYASDPRTIAMRAEEYLHSSGIADVAYFGPELEFFVFDEVSFDAQSHNSFFSLEAQETLSADGYGNNGHRPQDKLAYCAPPPVDTSSDLRSEMISVMEEAGIDVEMHHHEVAPSQHELGIKYNTLLKCADNIQLYKYIVHNVAHNYGKTATFMPKPVFGDNGSGMHVHQSLWKDGKPLFAGDKYGKLSETALYYIGGILKHARTLNAFTNPSTNSYKRLVPGYEAPVYISYSAKNRSASCRIPYTAKENGRRIEMRFPDPTANTYIAFAAMLMAGIDGIKNKTLPGDPMDVNLYALSDEDRNKVPMLCTSLTEAINALEDNHDFLMGGDVFTPEFIKSYVQIKRDEIAKLECMPHPLEFKMYYSL